ncbi:hypothetical protein B5K05_28105 [Rhizobium phaseoli]|uniref:DegT/DnrJ/EryC1/StrS family aminotransferase protein n=1 Tax=Rhizobium phaseoli TaxID=396 RepID=A0ABM6CHZ0_9HYPH|nr:DegT/DnrJ/EryC1/StrS family aminotransferase protein [Rhizobium phaseoli]ANL94391.1 DegT/DnrJ/EryC1/StrS family aminotransferase protein [Rhizobium phaseoli]RDJ03647.1 hypothetical protein B5K05_28105 [Rhizobium phaseoli]
MVVRYNYEAQFGDDIETVVGSIRSALLSGNYVLGENVRTFEDKFASMVGVAGCVGVGSGFDALVLALRALKISPGDKVVTQANTFYATAAAVAHVGADLVLVGCDADTFCMDLNKLEQINDGSISPFCSGRGIANVLTHLRAEIDELAAAPGGQEANAFKTGLFARSPWAQELLDAFVAPLSPAALTTPAFGEDRTAGQELNVRSIHRPANRTCCKASNGGYVLFGMLSSSVNGSASTRAPKSRPLRI